MKERPILFSAPLVQAILAGRKTVTRRVMRTNHVGYRAFYRWDGAPYRRAMMRCLNEDRGPGSSVFCEDNRFGVPGDILYVRETHAIVPASAYRCSREEDGSPVPHRVSPDGTEWAVYREGWTRSAPQRWRPSIHMPRWASRIELEITGVRVERLQEITEEDARAEGLDWAAPHFFDRRDHDDDREDPRDVGYPVVGETSGFARDNFRRLWESIYGAGSWGADPWVWAVSFRRVDGGES